MISIRDILIEHNVPHVGAEHHHGRPGWVQVDCPWCGRGAGRYHLGISLTTGAASCWRCGRQNTAAALAMLTGTRVGAMVEFMEGAVYEPAPVRKTGTLALPVGRGVLLPGHRMYLTRRGFNPARMAALWGVEGLGQVGRLRWRLFIPIHHHGEIVSWTTRSVNPKEPRRYISAAEDQEAVPHKQILYGADYARHAIIIHEGPLDVWATGPGAVAVCGTAYTPAQLAAMARYPVRAVCFDSEPVAQERARGLAAALSVYPGTTHNITLTTGADTAAAEPGEVAELRGRFLE